VTAAATRACHMPHSANGAGHGLTSADDQGELTGLDELDPRSLWSHRFPSADLVATAAHTLPAISDGVGDQREGPRFVVTVGPGLMGVSGRDWRAADVTDARQHRVNMERAADRLAGEQAAAALLALLDADMVNGRRVGDVTEQLYRLAASVDREKLAEQVDDYLRGQPGDSAAGTELAELLARLRETPVGARVIREWSRQSRANMVRRICSLDYGPLFADPGRLPAMVTTTYPGEWLSVAPDGRTCNREHWDRLRKRWESNWDEPARGVWKREFQGRGAPHYHLHTAPPNGRTTFVVEPRTWDLLTDPDDDTARLLGVTAVMPGSRDYDPEKPLQARALFRGWLAVVWAEIVDHPDPVEYRKHMRAGTGVDLAEGLRATDPKRLGVYFTKHGLAGGKEYQNLPPDEWPEGVSVGRFWGVWGLEDATAAVQVTGQDAVRVARTLRRMSHAQGRYVVRTRPRIEGGRVVGRNDHDVLGVAGVERVDQARIRWRRTRVRYAALTTGRGWVSMNNGPATAVRIGGWLTHDPGPDRLATPLAERLADEPPAERLAELRARRAERLARRG
jgi:hypothetical protein